jgi:hypothetical protein
MRMLRVAVVLVAAALGASAVALEVHGPARRGARRASTMSSRRS